MAAPLCAAHHCGLLTAAPALFAASLSGLPHRHLRPDGKIRFDPPVFARTTYSVHTVGCSFDRDSTEDLATYGAVGDPWAILPMCMDRESAADRDERRPREVTGILALAL